MERSAGFRRGARLGRLAWGLWLVWAAPLWAATVVEVKPDRATGIYQAGEKVTWSVAVTNDGQPAEGPISYRVQRGGLTQVDQGKADLAAGCATISGTLNQPGCLLLTVNYLPTGAAKPVQGLGGAVFSPDGIQPSAPPPADFDAFWDAKLAELQAVPMNVQLEPIDVGQPDIEYWKVTMDNIRGTKIHGQLAKPKGKTKLPAVLTVQWAGVYPLDRQWVIGEAKRGRLTLNLMAHDLPIDEPKTFYDELRDGALKGYPLFGREDRDKSYFLRMYLSCYRGADYLAHHPDWDGQTLMVQGGSQGGGQSVITAGLFPGITALAPEVPAMCDHTGQLVGRAAGWPKLTGWLEKPDSEAALKVAGYYDAVNFARRVKAKYALVGVGLIDVTCPPEGVIAMYNQLAAASKQLVVMPITGHTGPHHEPFYQAKEAWMAQFMNGH